MHDLIAVLPEIIVAGGACLLLLWQSYAGGNSGAIALALLTLSAALIASLAAEPASAFGGAVQVDGLAGLLRPWMLAVMALALLYAHPDLARRDIPAGEFHALALFAGCGMLVLASAASLLSLYLGLELLSLSLYAMVALRRDDPRASEAAMKYFVLGAIASGMLLYGMSMLYGATASLLLDDVAAALQAAGELHIGFMFGLVFVVVGVAFKLGAVPFHMWVPDVYQGAPTASTLFVASAPKLAAVALLLRLLDDGLGGLQVDWRGMLAALAIASIAVGNVVAIAQTSLKRMLAYSTIAHIGFLLLGMLPGSADGYAATLFYAVTYALTSAAAFGMLLLLSRSGFEAEEISDFAGLFRRSPWFAFVMLFVVFSLAGVPPAVGFYAKLSVLRAALQADLLWIAVAAVLFSVIGAFYYLRLVKTMFFDAPTEQGGLEAGFGARCALSINGWALLGLGIYPAALMSACLAAVAG